MAIEELEDIVGQLADQLGIYGAHNENCGQTGNLAKGNKCRCCWTTGISARIMKSVMLEQMIREQEREVEKTVTTKPSTPLACKRCGHKWVPYVATPKRCPHCATPLWDLDRVRAVGGGRKKSR